MAFIKKFMRFLTLAENVICTVGLLGTTFLITFQILNRFWLKLSVNWINDFALFLFIFFVFFAIVLTTRIDGHTTVDILVDGVFARHPVGKAVYTLLTRAVCVATLVAFVKPAYEFALDAWNYPQPGNLVRWFNESWLMETLLVCVLLCIVHLVYNIAEGVAKIRALRQTSEKVGEQ